MNMYSLCPQNIRRTSVLILFYGFKPCFSSRHLCRFYNVTPKTMGITPKINLRCFFKLHDSKQSLWFPRKYIECCPSMFSAKTVRITLYLILQCFHRKLPENCVSLFPMLISMFRSITLIIAHSAMLDVQLWMCHCNTKI
jgi:hypothetical protein